MKNNLSDLYDYLFKTLETLKDTQSASLETEIKRATAVRLTANSIIDAAKLEIGIRKLSRNVPQSTFFDTAPKELPKTPDEKKRLGNGDKHS
jgi:hypothetical protein